MQLTVPAVRPIGRPRIRTIVGAFAAILLGLVLGGLLVVAVATTLLGYRVLDIASGSMEPALNRGDLILSRPAPIGQVKQGDIIVFQEGEQVPVLVAHRVAAVINLVVNATSKSTGVTMSSTTPAFRTKGDANPDLDGSIVDAAHYRGVVWFVLPGLGTPLLGYPVSHIFLAVAVLTALLWACYEVVGLARRRRARRLVAPTVEERPNDG
ncbi:MAG: signal peptidase I [Isosphaeraceae bacterium]|nr:signal peptidase I [Isosphaeraceae bacterium]